jgi:hypothetical protein
VRGVKTNSPRFMPLTRACASGDRSAKRPLPAGEGGHARGRVYNLRPMRWPAALASVLLFSCASAPSPTDQPIPSDWLQIAQTPQFPALSYDAGGVLLYTPRVPMNAGVRVVESAAGAKLVSGDKDLTPEYRAIDSFDVSLDRREIAFSARRTDNFDIGLVSLDGSEVHWVPPDPVDEIAVQYAPRGNKISYIVRARGGDLVRTVHIPTSMPLSADFPYGRVNSLTWEPRAERYAVSWSSVDGSARVELMTYAGDERKVVVAPAVHLDVSTEPIGGALVLRPSLMRYGEKLPLVVWRTSDRNAWSDARGALEREVPAVCAVLDHDPDPAFWNAMAAVPWIDTGRIFVVGVERGKELAGPITWIAADPSVPAGRYRKTGNVVAVAPALVQSVGAAWVAHQLKGHPPANGSHR